MYMYHHSGGLVGSKLFHLHECIVSCTFILLLLDTFVCTADQLTVLPFLLTIAAAMALFMNVKSC